MCPVESDVGTLHPPYPDWHFPGESAVGEIEFAGRVPAEVETAAGTAGVD